MIRENATKVTGQVFRRGGEFISRKFKGRKGKERSSLGKGRRGKEKKRGK